MLPAAAPRGPSPGARGRSPATRRMNAMGERESASERANDARVVSELGREEEEAKASERRERESERERIYKMSILMSIPWLYVVRLVFRPSVFKCQSRAI